MTTLLVQTLPDLGQSVLERVRNIIASSSDERIRRLLTRIPASPAGQPFRLVVTGEYNAGKSTILKALTGEDILIHSNVSTAEVSQYPWRHVLLFDTPGVGAGIEPHDELAEQALRDADLVLFVVTVDLFDDVTAAHLRHVAFELGKFDQMVIVVNKAATMAAAPGVREAAVRDALGTEHAPLTLVECDAKCALGAVDADGERSAYLRRVGNLPALEAALNTLVVTGGTAGRLRAPFQAALAVVRDLRPFLEPEPEEQALADLLERRREILAQSRLRLCNRIEAAYGATRDRIVRAGDVLALAARDGAVPEPAMKEFEDSAQQAAQSLQGLIERAFEAELTELAAEDRGLAAGPEAQTLADAGMVGFDFPSTPAAGSGFHSDDGGASSFWQQMTALFGSHGQNWLGDVIRGGGRSGSTLHEFVLTLGHKFGYRFRPWEAVNWASRLSAAATAGLFLFDVWQQTNAVRAEEDAIQRQQLSLRSGVRGAAAALIEAASEQVAPIVDRFYLEAARPLVELDERLVAVRQERAVLTEGLARVERDCLEALDLVNRGPVTGRAA